MITRVEVARDGTTPLRVYHRAGTTEQGPDTRYSWTHPYADKPTCLACQNQTLPPEVRGASK